MKTQIAKDLLGGRRVGNPRCSHPSPRPSPVEGRGRRMGEGLSPNCGREGERERKASSSAGSRLVRTRGAVRTCAAGTKGSQPRTHVRSYEMKDFCAY